MSRDRVNSVWTQATAAGVLPANATLPEQESRPWPVVLLTALGAWLAAVPLLGVVGMLLGDLIHRGAGPYVIGVLVLAAALVVLRSRSVPLFVEQLADHAQAAVVEERGHEEAFPVGARDPAEGERQARAPAHREQRRGRRFRGCLCSYSDWPGQCPGPENCPVHGQTPEDMV